MSRKSKTPSNSHHFDQLLLYLELFQRYSDREWTALDESLLQRRAADRRSGVISRNELVETIGSFNILTSASFESLRKRSRTSGEVVFGEGNSFGYMMLPPYNDSLKSAILLSSECFKITMEYRFAVDVYISTAGVADDYPYRRASYRFESPHHESSSHDYHHMQFTSLEEVNWLLDGIPCVPTNAGDAVAQLLILFLSFYGAQNIRKLVTGTQGLDTTYIEFLPPSCQ